MDSPAKKMAKTEIGTALGVTKFRKLLEKSTIFIDKSLLIKDFLQSTAEVLLITCPRRWGKSINMDMIKTFLEIEVNQYGEKHQEKESTSNYRLFAKGMVGSGDRLEKPLYISQCDNIMKEYQGEYPVISVDFKNVKGRNYEDILTGVKLAISDSFEQHKYMREVLDRIKNNEQSTNSEREDARDFLLQFNTIYKNNAKEATQSDIGNSLKFLSKLLHNHFKKKVFVLMDEYDMPINNILRSAKFSSEDLDNTMLLLDLLMGSTFKGNDNYLEKAYITGIYRIAKASLFSGLNNIEEHNFLDNEFARYYGFNRDEVTGLFKEYNISPELSQRAKDWYNGYCFSIDPDLQMYNPWSIVNFIKKEKIKNYWEESGNTDFIKKLFKVDDIKTKIFALINKEDVSIDLKYLKFSKEDFLTLKNLVNPNMSVSVAKASVNLFFCFIFASGYLTIDVAKSSDTDIASSIRLPNLEVADELAMKLRLYYEELYKITHEAFTNAIQAFQAFFSRDENKAEFQEALQELCSQMEVADMKDTKRSGVHPNEDLFHSIINVIAMQSRYRKFGTEITCNTGIERGRADIVLMDDDIQLGMIIEVKYGNSSQEGLEQAKKYASLFIKYPNIKFIKYVGIDFSLKTDAKDKPSVEVCISATLEDRQVYTQ